MSGLDAISYAELMDAVPGWFVRLDAWLFIAIDMAQRNRNVRGDLLEIGTYLGRSSILLGFLAREDEDVVVCDLFESDAPSGLNQEENFIYSDLRRQAFEANYLSYHDFPPTIWAGPSSTLTLPPESIRFAHVDGSHLYDLVTKDIDLVLSALGPDGIVVFDDWATPRTMGVAAAVWEAVTRQRMKPFAATADKLYCATETVPSLVLDAPNEVINMGDYQVVRFWDEPSRRRQILDNWIPKAAHGPAIRMMGGLRAVSPLGRNRQHRQTIHPYAD